MPYLISSSDVSHFKESSKHYKESELALKIMPLLKGYTLSNLRNAVSCIETAITANSIIDYQD